MKSAFLAFVVLILASGLLFYARLNKSSTTEVVEESSSTTNTSAVEAPTNKPVNNNGTTKTYPTPTTTTIYPTPYPTPSAPPPTPKKLVSVRLGASDTTLLVGENSELSVSGYYTGGVVESISPTKVTWKKSVNLGTINSGGFFSSSKSGTVTITAELEGIPSNGVTIKIDEPVVELKKLDITYVKASTTPPQLPTTQFKAIATYTDNTTKTVTTSTTWSVSGSAGGSINSSGLYTPSSNGSATVKGVYQDLEVTNSFFIP